MSDKVFVYGTLMHGQRLHHALEAYNASKICRGITQRNDLTMHNTGWFPIVMARPKGLPIIGEVWLVTDENLHALDRVEGIGVLFNRKKIIIESLNEQSNIPTHHAWIYLGIHDYWFSSDSPRHLPLCRIGTEPVRHFSFI